MTMTPTVLPPERLVAILADARGRGEPFERTWPPAVVAATTGHAENVAWVAALNATREAWQRAFDGKPATRRERAITLMAEDAELVGPRPAVDRACDRCGGEIPEGRHRNARYCSPDCKRATNYGRERVAA